MNSRTPPYRIAFWTALALGLAVFLTGRSAHANVYASNVRLNGTTNSVSSPSGTNVTISYILNEPASLGVTISILSGGTPVRTLTAPAGGPGALQGTNSVSWDGQSDGGTNLPSGVYLVSITAASTGYTNWTQITTDTNLGNIVYEPNGIAVDKNQSSPYYGRVFVTISQSNPDPGTNPPPGSTAGILKLNADGSLADEGTSVTGGYNWTGLSGTSQYSPWKIAVSPDDYVYVEDWVNFGDVYRWDPLLSTNSQLYVLRPDNYDASLNSLSGPIITGSGPNARLWMVDNNAVRGVIQYRFTASGTCASNNIGTTIVGPGTATNNLSLQPYEVSVDKNGVMYVAQDGFPGNAGDLASDPGPRILRFPAYNPATNHNNPELKADWAIGGDTNTAGAYGVAVDPTGVYVAASFIGYTTNFGTTYQNGNTQIFYATNGAPVASLDLGLAINGETNHLDRACTWDSVGNVYYVDTLANGNLGGAWRAFSPPGTNQATTLAPASILVGSISSISITITGISISNGTVNVTFAGPVGDLPSSYTLLGSSTLSGTFSAITGASVTTIGAGLYQAAALADFVGNPVKFFYRIRR